MCSKNLFGLLLVYFTSATSYAQRDQIFFRTDYNYIQATQSFYKFHTLPSTWIDAKQLCALEGASLFYPENDDEAHNIMLFWNETQSEIPQIFIGISDLTVKGFFVTVDGKFSFYNNWLPGEPNNSGGAEDCVVLHKDGLYNDKSCTLKLQYICKKRLQDVQWNRPCNLPYLDYVYSEEVGKCYKFSNTAMSWTDAFKVCAAKQTYLAVINSEIEFDYFLSLIRKSNDHNAGASSNDTIHLGFHNRLDDGWQTLQGTAVEVTGYTRWGEGQPDGTTKGVVEKCGSISYIGHLNDISCDKKSFFICESDVTVQPSAKDKEINILLR